ncbi:MAG: MvdC family ATP-grasp ribosomal peptide maturase [Proteobacteria bacterium]|nr:MvdC family ATP-grasp ribosomal peptide maturase [Pseudomonadota bacterium]
MSTYVLCLTHSGDYFTIDRVMEALDRYGKRPVRIDTDRFPTSLRIALQPELGASRIFLPDGRVINAGQIGAVWLRKIFPPKFDEDLEPKFRDGCMRESAEAFRGMLDLLASKPWIDPLRTIERCESKAEQLRLAKSVGLSVPPTLISNDQDEVRAFYEAQGGAVVTKMLTPLTVSMGKPDMFVYTSPVSPQDLDHLDDLRFSPMVFQKRIPKAYELRAIYVDGELFLGKIEATSADKAPIDWRHPNAHQSSWQRGELPEDVKRKLIALMDGLGLVFGALDIIKTPDNDYVFLEVNPRGEWGMLEMQLDLAISDAIARAITKRMT